MAKLLVVDPLDLELLDERGSLVWSSRSCFDACLGDEIGLACEYVAATDPQLCRMAMASDGVILGGSEESAWKDTAFNDHLLDLIAICKNNEIPLLGICFGAQLLGRALGGHVGPHPEGIELGAPAIRISEKGKQHYLFKGIQTGCIWSVETHNDAVLTLPPDCELLASTGHTPVQAFSFRGLLSGVQFHPEMNAEDLRYLWESFKRRGILATVPDEAQRILAACECGRVESILRNFAAHVRERKSARIAI